MSIFKRNSVNLEVPSLPAPEPEPHPDEHALDDYQKMFNEIKIRDEWKDRVAYAAKLIFSSKARYETVSKKTGVPWAFIGALHHMESNCDFTKHLHNGDSLKKRTVQVPRNRPPYGSGPYSWEESALDALAYDNIKPPLNTESQMLHKAESYNGVGYKRRGVPSPYLWSGTQFYSRGKYVRDGVYDPNVISKQVGVAAILWQLKKDWNV